MVAMNERVPATSVLMASPGLRAVSETVTLPLMSWNQRALQEKMPSILYYALVGLVDGSAYELVDQIEDGNGFEAWRRLYERHARTNNQIALMVFAILANAKIEDKAFEAAEAALAAAPNVVGEARVEREEA